MHWCSHSCGVTVIVTEDGALTRPLLSVTTRLNDTVVVVVLLTVGAVNVGLAVVA